MKSVSQITKLTGVSARTLQYYDEIGLLKPSKKSSAGYRLYDDETLQKLQQILFFKELGFKLQEIHEFVYQPNYDKIAAYKKQKELLLLRRNRTDRLIQLLGRLEKGEQCMSFKEFDLTSYIDALNDFKKSNTEAIAKYWGDMENYETFVEKVKEDESEVAKLAIQYYGSVGAYTEAMKYNLEHFSEIMEQKMTDEVKEVIRQSENLYARLLENMTREAESDEIQQIVKEMDMSMQGHASGGLDGDSMRKGVIDSYSSSDYLRTITDTKHGAGASDYIVRAFRYYSNNADK